MSDIHLHFRKEPKGPVISSKTKKELEEKKKSELAFENKKVKKSYISNNEKGEKDER